MVRAFVQKGRKAPRRIALQKPLDLPPGAWQIFWFGKLTTHPNSQRTPFIRTYLARVELREANIATRYSEVAHVDIPVSDLTALPLGTVFDNTMIYPRMPLHQSAQWADFTVDFSRENIHVFPRLAVEADGKRLLPYSERARRDDPEYEGLLLAVGSSDGATLYLFPCMTIFQFFWAQSSSWAQLMVDGRFVHYDRHVFNARRSYLSKDGDEAMVWLRQRMFDDDAPFIATLAFDPYALEVGADIYRHLARAARGTEERCIRALPPYQGHIPLRALVHRVSTKQGPAMLVQAIGQCGYVPSIKKLMFDRDNDGRTTDEIAEGVEKTPMDRESFAFPVLSILEDPTELSDNPPSNQKAPFEIAASSPYDLFPGLGKVVTEKLPQEETTYENEREQAKRLLERWEHRVSSLEGALSSEQLAPQALIRGEHHAEALDEDDPTPVRGDMKQLADTLLTGQSFELKIRSEVWRASPQLVEMPGQIGHYFRVPKNVDGVALAWLYRDRDKFFRKRALCIRVVFTNSSCAFPVTRYLLDFEPRQSSGTPRQTRILLFWNYANTPLHDEQGSVRKLIEAIARKGQAGISTNEMGGLLGYPRNHPPVHEVTHRFLQSMLIAQNKM